MTAKREKLLWCARARAHARRSYYGFFHNSKSWLLDGVSHCGFFTSERAQKTTRHFDENDTSFYEKQHVTLKKTTRRFMKNKHSFYRKQHVIFWEKSHKSKQNKKNPPQKTCINISIKPIFKHKIQGDVQKIREEMRKNRGKAKRILQSKKGIYPLFA